MTGRRSRNKGRQGEYETRDAFRAAMPFAEIKRGIGQARAGSEVADVDCPYFWIENKRGKKPNPRAALQQAKDACKDPSKWPVAVIRDDYKEAFVVMDLTDFLELVADWYERGMQ